MLSKQTILDKTNNGFEIFRYYIDVEWRLGKNFRNPLYDDKKASCNIYFDRKARIYRFKDFGNDSYSGDCFSYVGFLKGMDCNNAKDFIEILEIINRDLHLGISGDNDGNTSLVISMSPKPIRDTKPVLSQKPETPKKTKPYSVVQQAFSAKDKMFWQQYGITSEVLKNYKVFSLKEFKSENNEGKTFAFSSSDTEPMFSYQGKRHVKIYRPFSDIRFLYGGNLGENYCFGLEQLPAKGDTLFITGGEKDVLSLVSYGFHAICFNSETSNISQHIIKKLSYRFKHVILLYDTDKTGLDASLKHSNSRIWA
jgi:hypothetical protein